MFDQPAAKIRPWVTGGLIAMNLWVFVLEWWATDVENFIYRWAFIPVEFVWTDWNSWIKLWTAMFLHQGWGHLISNLWFLHLFGDNVEEDLGHLKFLLFYFVCGTTAGLLQYWFVSQLDLPMLGASGAIAGVLGYYWQRFPAHRVTTLVLWGWWWEIVQVPAHVVLGFWFFSQMFSGLASVAVSTLATGGVAWWAHIGGFVTGWLIARFRVPSRSVGWQSWW